MDQKKLQDAARRLEECLIQHEASDDDAKSLHVALRGLIADALAELIVTPLETRDVPGEYFFVEGHLRQYQDLEQAYTQFVIQITGGENSLIRRIARQIEAKNKP